MTSTDIASRSPAREGARSLLRARWLRGRVGNGLLREVALVAGAMLVYFGVRNLTAGAPDEAFANGQRIANFERWVGIDWEDAVQASIARSDVLVMLANWVYIWGHWPVILLRRSSSISGGAIATTYSAMRCSSREESASCSSHSCPSLRRGYSSWASSIRCRAGRTPSARSNRPALPISTQPFRACTSAGTSRWESSYSQRRRTWRPAFAVLAPLAMGFAVVATANHFVVDVAAGVAVVLVGLAGALLIEKRRAADAATLAGDDWAVSSVERDQRFGADGRSSSHTAPGIA